MHTTRTDHAQVAKANAEVEVKLSGRGSGGIKRAAVAGSIGFQLDSGAPTRDGKGFYLDRADADQDGKVSGMSPGAATVIRAVMIRENLDRAHGLDCGEARQDQQDKKNSAYFVPASDLRESTGDAHA